MVRIFTWSPQNLTAPLGAEDFGSALHKTSSSLLPFDGNWIVDHKTATQQEIDDGMLWPHDNQSEAFVFTE